MKNQSIFLLLATSLLLLSGCNKSSGGYDTTHTHNYGEWAVTTPATCTEYGEKTRECSCGKTETELIPSKGHSFVTVDEEATCTEPGRIGRVVCRDCGEVSEEGTPTSPVGHDYDERGVCSRCEDSTAIDLHFVPSEGEKRYDFTQNGKQSFMVNIPCAMKLGFGLYSKNGLGTSGYTFYYEDGTVLASNIVGVNSFEINEAQKIYIVVDVVDYTSAKYFRVSCNHTADPTGKCTVCGNESAISAASYFTSTGAERRINAGSYVILKLAPNASYTRLGVSFTYPSGSSANFEVEYVYSNEQYLTVDSNNTFTATESDMFIKIKNAGASGVGVIKIFTA